MMHALSLLRQARKSVGTMYGRAGNADEMLIQFLFLLPLPCIGKKPCLSRPFCCRRLRRAGVVPQHEGKPRINHQGAQGVLLAAFFKRRQIFLQTAAPLAKLRMPEFRVIQQTMRKGDGICLCFLPIAPGGIEQGYDCFLPRFFCAAIIFGNFLIQSGQTVMRKDEPADQPCS